MVYQNMVPGVFLDRPNRFIAHVEFDGTVETVHVKNTGRCRELLVPGATVYCQRSGNPARKTKYDLIAVEKNGRLINMDSPMGRRGSGSAPVGWDLLRISGRRRFTGIPGLISPLPWRAGNAFWR